MADVFKRVFGFPEAGYRSTQEQLRANSKVDAKGNLLIRKHGEGYWQAGRFETPSLGELRAQAEMVVAELSRAAAYGFPANAGKPMLTHVKGDSNELHNRPAYEGGVVQAASQFNCLEFAAPSKVPEHGISCYASDHTQGPACALACFAGTAQRNYLYEWPDGAIGQTTDRQINCLTDVEAILTRAAGGRSVPFWVVRNGYIESSGEALVRANELLADRALREQLRCAHRVGVHWDTEVTNEGIRRTSPLLVTQVYASAVSVGYSRCAVHDWEPLARLVLDALYEATMLVGVINNARRLRLTLAPVPVLLTKVGGGAFANDAAWIKAAIRGAQRAVQRFGIPVPVDLTYYSRFESEYADLSTA